MIKDKWMEVEGNFSIPGRSACREERCMYGICWTSSKENVDHSIIKETIIIKHCESPDPCLR
jgi:hypothetical protein